jgi:hypothetical protein
MSSCDAGVKGGILTTHDDRGVDDITNKYKNHAPMLTTLATLPHMWRKD